MQTAVEYLFAPALAVRYYSLARHALHEALRLASVGNGDRVLLPDYLCRDLLASLEAVGAVPVWYTVGRDLSPQEPETAWPPAKAVLAVNYFGFAQNLAPFRAYAERTGAVLIEDNAHGFLSRDCEGVLLGTRAPLGLFSLRKTFLSGRGAALTANCSEFATRLPSQLPFAETPPPRAIRVRQGLRAMFHSRLPEYLLARMVRASRRMRGLSAIPLPAADAEMRIPEAPNPDAFLIPLLARQDAEGEVARRRALYNTLLAEASALKLQAIFPVLPAHAAPYGLPLLAERPAPVAELAARYCLDYFKWPDLPDARRHMAPDHYTKIYLINFL